MTNSESFAHISQAISNTNAALAVYDSLVERVATGHQIVSTLEAELAAIRSNEGHLEARARGTKFTATNSALSLAQLDLQSAQDALVTQKALTAATGKAAASQLFEVRDLLRMHRLKNVSAQLDADFDLTTLPVRLHEVASTHKSIRALKDLGVAQLYFQLQHDDGFAIGAVRHLEEHWQQLKSLAEAENVELVIAAVPVPTIPKPKPAPTTANVLGTMVAVAA